MQDLISSNNKMGNTSKKQAIQKSSVPKSQNPGVSSVSQATSNKAVPKSEEPAVSSISQVISNKDVPKSEEPGVSSISQAISNENVPKNQEPGVSSICQQAIYNQIVPNSQEPGFSFIYRQKGLKQLITFPKQKIKTIRDIINQAGDLYGNKRGLGQIIVTNETDEKDITIEKRTVKEYTYKQIFDHSYNLGRALTARGLYFKESERGMNILGIYSKNRLEWFISDWACCLFGYTSVPLYDTLGKDNLAIVLEMTELTTLFVSNKTAATLQKFYQKGTLKHLILYDKVDQELQTKLKDKGLQLLNFWELIEQGSKLDITNKDIEVKPEDVYSFCYTSGTTGSPKGALITHRNLLAGITNHVIHKDLSYNSKDVYLSFLPLPHLLERGFSLSIFLAGAFLVISSGNVMKVKEDLCAIKATIFVSVPRLFNRIVEQVNATLATMVTDEAKRPMIQAAVYQKVKQSFGGQLRIMCTGGAPTTDTVHSTMQKIMGCPLIQGYGQTEFGSVVLFGRATTTDFGVLHQINPGVEIKLCDLPQMKYTSKDTDSEGRSTPRGQLWVRTPMPFPGYYKLPDFNKQTVTADGWVCSGDVAEITPNCAFRIIDRKKNIFKLQQGVYISPDVIETAYMKSGIVEEIFFHGDSSRYFAVAIVSPAKHAITKMAEDLGLKGTNEEIYNSYQLRSQFLNELNVHARKEGVLGFELAKNIYFEPNGFASKNILTNSLKLIRHEARNVYKAQIEELYKQGELKMDIAFGSSVSISQA